MVADGTRRASLGDAMKRPFVAFVFACLGTSAVVACSGAIESTPAPPATVPEAGPPIRLEAGVDAEPPLRDVTAPLVIDLGNVAYGQDVTFKVPPGALGFNIVVEARTGLDGTVGIARITSPSGELVHDGYMPKGGSHTTSLSSGFGALASASVPQSEAKSANTPEAGTWTFRVGGGGELPPPPLDAGLDGATMEGGTSGPATLHAEVRIQMGSATGFVGGRLDLHVFVPPGLKIGTKRLDATTAATDEGVERRIAAFFDALSLQVGIDRGEVTFHPAQQKLVFIDDESALVDAFASSSGRPDGQALNLMLTNGIDLGGGSSAWGIAPGIPGVAARTGTSMSGIVLAVGDTPAVGDGLTVLHEAGHFFGLNHTTELYGSYADPLSDTPVCEAISIDDPSTLQACPDRMNIMFPAFYGTSGAVADVSDAQRAVVRGSPIYKAYREPVKGTKSRGGQLIARPGEQITLTKSGRPLTPVETWLSSSLCGHATHGKLDANVFAGAKGRPQTIVALRAAAADADLPDVMRRQAAGALRALGAAAAK